MTNFEAAVMIAAVAAGMLVTRFLPFILFPDSKTPPKAVEYLGKVLPPAMMGLLFVYCLRNVSIFDGSRGIPEGVSIAVIVLLHVWKRNTLISVIGGTAVYMLLTRLIFI